MPPPIHVLVTRAAQQGSELAEQLRARGLDPVLIPALETAEPLSFAALDSAIADLSRFHWLLFTSANAVEAFARRLHFHRDASPELGGSRSGPDWLLDPATRPRVAAIGPATARALQAVGLPADLIPRQAVAEALAEALLPHARLADGMPTRFLFVRAEEAREHLPATLRAAGADLTIAPAYRTVIPAGSVALLHNLLADPLLSVRAITFTSSSSAHNLLALCAAAGVTLPGTALRISIGPITSQTLHDLGYPPDAESPEPNVASLAQTVVQTLETAGRS